MAENEGKPDEAKQGDLFAPPVPVPPGDVHPEEISGRQLMLYEKITEENKDRLVSEAKALVDYSNKIREIALKNTNANDWVLFDDKPYMTEGGVKKTLSLCGASVIGTKIEKEILKEAGGLVVIYFTATGKICFNNRIYENIGTSSTKDRFFAERRRYADHPEGQWKKGDKYLLDLDEVDIPSVRKKSVTNLQHRLLDMILTLRPTKEDLKNANITVTQGFRHSTGAKGGSTDSADEKKVRTEIASILARVASDRGLPEADVLRGVTAFQGFNGYDNVDRVSSKMLNKTLGKLKSMDKAPAQGDGAQ